MTPLKLPFLFSKSMHMQEQKQCMESQNRQPGLLTLCNYLALQWLYSYSNTSCRQITYKKKLIKINNISIFPLLTALFFWSERFFTRGMYSFHNESSCRLFAVSNLNALTIAYSQVFTVVPVPLKLKTMLKWCSISFLTSVLLKTLLKNGNIPTFLSGELDSKYGKYSAWHEPFHQPLCEGSTCLTLSATSQFLPITHWLLRLRAESPVIVFSPLGGTSLPQAQHESRNRFLFWCMHFWTKEIEPDSAHVTTLFKSCSPLLFNILFAPE